MLSPPGGPPPKTACSTTSTSSKFNKTGKYRNVSSRLDTGPNMRKILAQYEGTSGPNARPKQKNEYFSTMKPLTLAKLLEPCIEEEESVYKFDADEVASVASAVSSVVLKDADATPAQQHGNLLILDLRSFEEYEKCHIYGAMHYDRTDLNKSTNNFPREVYFFKGSADSDKIVLLYDEDGKGLGEAGNHFVEKGVENTYVLAGGFKGVCSRCPHILSAEPPEGSCTVESLSAGMAARGRSESGRCSTACSSCTQNTNLSSCVSAAAKNASSKKIAGPWK
uniref:Rhodanese domain-containing protein n=1 Tax=Chrysotila carterae TaxID=13221 RepID=A0A6S9SA23_CHRCT|mmetsp:Transcript_35803/g.75244  ORF Transcript_35803/g.75244 Transcript_35803/m.75244 type:complete len:280 (-) Transcript_35803:452-1291(-)